MADDLDITVRDHAPDRWLSSRFVADESARADLIVLYALDHELTRIPQVVTDPLMGEIRMTWWREGLEEIAEGRAVRAHPVLRAIAASKLPAVALAARRLSEQATADQVTQAARAFGLAYCDAPAAQAALKGASGALEDLPLAAFPAVAHATLARAYTRNKNPGPLEKRTRVLWAVLTGRI